MAKRVQYSIKSGLIKNGFHSSDGHYESLDEIVWDILRCCGIECCSNINNKQEEKTVLSTNAKTITIPDTLIVFDSVNDQDGLYILKSNVDSGTLVFGTNGAFVYQKPEKFSTASFTYYIQKGNQISNTATVILKAEMAAVEAKK